MLLGAAGCASGNQTCNGIMPAFTPNPTRNNANSASRLAPWATAPDSMTSNGDSPVSRRLCFVGTDNYAITLGGTTIGGGPYSSAVTPAALDHFAFATVGSKTAGTAFTIDVTAKDQFNNTVTAFSGGGNTVTFTSTSVSKVCCFGCAEFLGD